MAFFTKRYHPAGTPPGTLSRPLPVSKKALRIRLVDYDAQDVTILEDIAEFQSINDRLCNPASRLRSRGVDFLLYALLDIVVDQGFPVLEHFGRQLDDLEAEVLDAADRGTVETIHGVKRELIMLRGQLWPQREVINRLLRDEDGFISDGTRIYLRDCYDHTIQIIDLLEIYREMTAGMLEIYLSTVSNRMNDIMRLLTVIATVFIPLTFIVGVYGMNFDPRAGPLSMPELRQPLGYLAVWLIMIVIAGLMLVYFRRKRWL